MLAFCISVFGCCAVAWRLRNVTMLQDMRISNIMEHRGNVPFVPKGFKDDKKKKNRKPVMLLRGALWLALFSYVGKLG